MLISVYGSTRYMPPPTLLYLLFPVLMKMTERSRRRQRPRPRLLLRNHLRQLLGSRTYTYDWSNPGFSETTGHFTQIVWKATTPVGCGKANCPGENRVPNNPDYFVVCQSYPPGNIVNPIFFAENVGELVSESLSVGIPAGSGSGSGGSNQASGNSTSNGNEAQKSGCGPMKDGKNNVLKIVLAMLTAGTPLALSVIL
jgi:hypothetical protein